MDKTIIYSEASDAGVTEHRVLQPPATLNIARPPAPVSINVATPPAPGVR